MSATVRRVRAATEVLARLTRGRVAALVVAAAVAGAACGDGDESAPDARVDAVGSFFPLADALRAVGGAAVAVDDLTPAGAEPHDLELTPGAREAIDDADVVVVLGGGFQPAIEDAVDPAGTGVVVVLDVLGLDGDADPHVWLDPELHARVVEAVRDALLTADPDGATGYRERAADYVEEIGRVDDEYRRGLSGCARDLLVTSHDAFGRLADRYGLRYEPLTGRAPEAEPDPARLAELADLVRDEGVTTVFTEPFAPEEVALTLAREAGVAVEVLHPIEGAGGDAVAKGVTWASLMRDNLRALRAALGCA